MSDTTDSPAKKNALVRTGAFLVVVAVVLGIFFYLSSLDAPPNLPRDDTHAFRFDAKQRLVGLKSETSGGTTPEAEDLEYDLKAVEQRVNTTCQRCHGSFPKPADTAPRVCEQMNAPCLPATHPPKDTCIKCHRAGG